jgi:hypothetical protein
VNALRGAREVALFGQGHEMRELSKIQHRRMLSLHWVDVKYAMDA